MEDEVRDEDSIESVPTEKEYLKEFIRLWETCPELWNTSSNDYRDKVKKNIGLDKLLVIYKKIKPTSTREDVKKKLNSLRTNFRKELKKVTKSKSSGKGTDDIYVPSSWIYYELLFLTTDEQPVIQRQEVEDVESNINTESQDHQRYSVSSMDPPAPPTRTGTKKRKIDNQTLMERAVSFMERNDNDNNSEDQDEYHHLAMVWAAKLRKLTPTQKMFAEKAIHDVLFEAELQNLHRNSVKINDGNDSSSIKSRATTNTYYVPSMTTSPSTQNSNLYISSPSPQTATLYSFSNNKPIISSGDPAQIILKKPRESQSRHFNIVSQDTVYDSPSVITTTAKADIHFDAEVISSSKPAKIILKKPRESQSRHFNIVSQDTVYDSPSVITTTAKADIHFDAEVISSGKPAKIILKKPRESKSRHFNIVSQDTVYDSPSVITTTTKADMHFDAEVISSGKPAKIILNKPRESQSRHFNIVSQDTVYDSPSVITTTTKADMHFDAEVISSGKPAKIILKKPRESQSHFNIVSQDTVHDSPSVITTTKTADVQCDAEDISDPSKMSLKEFIQIYQIDQ